MKVSLPVVLFVLGVGAILSVVGIAVYQEATEPKEGTVVRKEYSPAQSWTTSDSSCTGNVAKGTYRCTTTLTPHYTPECYEVVYENQGKRGDACVSPEEYMSYHNGDWFGSKEK